MIPNFFTNTVKNTNKDLSLFLDKKQDITRDGKYLVMYLRQLKVIFTKLLKIM
jgi:hypothetical protein